jgi:hypothetical protein
MLTVLSIYIFARRLRFGLEAALMTSMLPTTVGILGPGFIVPVAMGLIFISLSLFIVYYLKGLRAYLMLFIIFFFMLSLHAATAVGLILLLFPFIILNLRGNFKQSIGVTLSLVIPFFIAILLFPGIKNNAMIQTFETVLSDQSNRWYVDIPELIVSYGYIPILLCMVGAPFLMIKGGKVNYGLVWGLVTLLIAFFIFHGFGYGSFLWYGRSFHYIWLIMSIIGGAGLAELMKFISQGWFINRVKNEFLKNNAWKILSAAVIVIMLGIGIQARQHIPYYYMIDNKDYEAFVWIRDNVDSGYKKAILDPWKGTAFTAITGKYIYARLSEKADKSDIAASDFLDRGSENTTFLKKNGITIVYTTGSTKNTNLVEVRDNVYLLR